VAQAEFLRVVSHDLRAPLRHITSYGKLVREVLGDLPADVLQSPPLQEAQEFIGTMEQSARRMALMLDGLQALSRARSAPLHLQPVDLAAAVAQAQAGVHAGAHAVPWSVAADLPTLQADPALLRELLVQVLGNAVKFSQRQPSATIAVRTVPAERGAGYVAWEVQDNGAGFNPERAAGLFGIFQRLHRETEFDGVGAGLAVCRAIAERHGAHITATAAVGQGCTVRVEWPAPQATVMD
jgi:signal transduction histidine kinase